MLKLRLSMEKIPHLPVKETLVCGGRAIDIPDSMLTPFVLASSRNRECFGDMFAKGLGFAAYWDSADGYGHASNLYTLELLRRHKIPVLPYWHPLNPANSPDRSEYPLIRRLAELPITEGPNISLAFTIPDDLYIVPASPCLVGFTMWETDRLPPGRADMFAPFDLMLAPSEFCRQTFIASGCKVPVEVCGLPVDPLFAPTQKLWPTPKKGEPYRFLFVSTPIYRKGIDVLIEGFEKAFPRSKYGPDKVALHLHTRRWSYAPSIVESDVRAMVERDDRITLSVDRKTREEMRHMYSQHHCLAHTARAEGLGYTPLQAMTAGMPVVCPATTGMADFINHETAWVVENLGWEKPENDGFYSRESDGHWTLPSPASAAEQMRLVFYHRKEATEKALAASEAAWGVYSPAAATDTLLGALRKAWGIATRRTKRDVKAFQSKFEVKKSCQKVLSAGCQR